MTHKEAKAAAKWWADTLRTLPAQDNGDGFQSALGTMLQRAGRSLTDEEIQTFEDGVEAVVEKLIDRAEEWRPGRDKWFVVLSTDYGPDMELREAIDRLLPGDARTLVGNKLPWKTVMHINPGEVKVSRGYGAELVDLAVA